MLCTKLLLKVTHPYLQILWRIIVSDVSDYYLNPLWVHFIFAFAHFSVWTINVSQFWFLCKSISISSVHLKSLCNLQYIHPLLVCVCRLERVVSEREAGPVLPVISWPEPAAKSSVMQKAGRKKRVWEGTGLTSEVPTCKNWLISGN